VFRVLRSAPTIARHTCTHRESLSPAQNLTHRVLFVRRTPKALVCAHASKHTHTNKHTHSLAQVVLFAEEARAQGVDVELFVEPGMVHVFPLLAPLCAKDSPAFAFFAHAAALHCRLGPRFRVSGLGF